VGSLNRPGGNVTGVFNVSATVEGKQLGLLREVVKRTSLVAHMSAFGAKADMTLLSLNVR
jgi:hypothetical protein